MSTPVLFTFATDEHGENLLEIRSRFVGRRRLRVTAKHLARQFGMQFAVGIFPLPKGSEVWPS